MSGRKNRMAKRKSGIYLNASQMQDKNAKLTSGAMKAEGERKARTDELIRKYTKKDT